MSDHDIATMQSVTGGTVSQCKQLLEATGNDINQAIELFFASGGTPSVEPRPNNAREPVRAGSIGTVTPQMVGSLTGGTSLYTDYTQPSTDVTYPEVRPPNRSNPPNSNPGGHAGSLDQVVKDTLSNMSVLERQFAPPSYSVTGSLRDVCLRATPEKKWVLVALYPIENEKSSHSHSNGAGGNKAFISKCLNRDLWNNELVKNLIDCYYLLWQRPVSGSAASHSTKSKSATREGDEFAKNYNLEAKNISFPCILIIDPVTRGFVKEIPLSALSRKNDTSQSGSAEVPAVAERPSRSRSSDSFDIVYSDEFDEDDADCKIRKSISRPANKVSSGSDVGVKQTTTPQNVTTPAVDTNTPHTLVTRSTKIRRTSTAMFAFDPELFIDRLFQHASKGVPQIPPTTSQGSSSLTNGAAAVPPPPASFNQNLTEDEQLALALALSQAENEKPTPNSTQVGNHSNPATNENDEQLALALAMSAAEMAQNSQAHNSASDSSPTLCQSSVPCSTETNGNGDAAVQSEQKATEQKHEAVKENIRQFVLPKEVQFSKLEETYADASSEKPMLKLRVKFPLGEPVTVALSSAVPLLEFILAIKTQLCALAATAESSAVEPPVIDLMAGFPPKRFYQDPAESDAITCNFYSHIEDGKTLGEVTGLRSGDVVTVHCR